MKSDFSFLIQEMFGQFDLWFDCFSLSAQEVFLGFEYFICSYCLALIYVTYTKTPGICRVFLIGSCRLHDVYVRFLTI